MSDGGKGDKQIAAQVSQEQLTLNWSNVFGKSKLEQRLEAERLAKLEDNTGTDKNEYYDMQSVEDAVLEGLAKFADES